MVFQTFKLFCSSVCQLILTDDSFTFEKIISHMNDRFNELKERVVDRMEYIYMDTNNTKIEEEVEHSHKDDIDGNDGKGNELESIDQIKKEEDGSENQASTKKVLEAKTTEFFTKAIEEILTLTTEHGVMNLMRQGFILFERVAVKQLLAKKWARPCVSQFIKDIFFNKEAIFNPHQVEELEDIMEALNSTTSMNDSKML